ncbi:CCD42 protein, partial [Atractosteus spatula]|nr:CCD42 protein [Atractosteus spatula]
MLLIFQASSKILQTGVNTLQKTLVLKREVEVEDINRQLAAKRQDFANRMEALARRRAEFELKQKLTKERALKFDKFLQDNESKRRRALRNYQMERKHNELKEKEIQDLLQELEKLQVRQQHLKKKVEKNKMHEDYLLKIIDHLPENYLEYGADSLVMPIIRRHETLAVTNEALVRQLSSLSEELEKSQHKLESLHQEHDTNKLMTNSELSDLQIQYDRAKERNKQLEMNLTLHQGQFRNQSEELGSLLMAVTNLGEQCYIHHYGPLEDLNILTMLDMIKVKAETTE